MLNFTYFLLWPKLEKHSQCPCWIKWEWLKATIFKYTTKLGYNWLSPNLSMVPKLNEHWNLVSSNIDWCSGFKMLWVNYIEPKQAFFTLSLLFQGLIIGNKLIYLGVVNPLYPFYNTKDSFMHLFWLCGETIKSM